jgi:type VI secretion system secreted protein VgrG
MPAAGGQYESLLSISTPLGPDILRPVSFHAQEQIGAPFHFAADLVSTERTIEADRLLFQPVCVTVSRENSPDRYFHGIVRAFVAQGEVERQHYAYAMEIVPKLWFLSQTEDCRIFQKLTTKDIVTKLLGEGGISDYRFSIQGEQPQLPYVTQFNESDLAFATRLMQEAGWFYFFEHTQQAHKLIVADDNAVFRAIPDAQMRVERAGNRPGSLTAWRAIDSTVHGKVTLLDYDPAKPSSPPSGNQTTTLKTKGSAQRDVFRWPARDLTSSAASARALRQLEAAEARASLREGTGENQEFVPGGKFKLELDPLTGQGGTEFVIRSVSHAASDTAWVTGASARRLDYRNNFTAFPVRTKWREPETVPRPRMVGVHTALVLAPRGEEIYADAMGRVKVRFFWDHRKDSTDQTECWVRVLQPWTGRNSEWGWHHIPREGTEVAVSFMDGDPDRPVVIGCFYNDTTKPVFNPTTDSKTKTGLRTRSSLKGGAEAFSELSFDDKMGHELVFLHAQKDLTVEVENDQNLRVDNCRIVHVKMDETVTIDGKQAITVKGDQSLEVKQGNISTKADLGTISIEAQQSITLKCGASTIKIEPAAITLDSPQITLKGGMTVTIKGGLSLALEGGLNSSLKGGVMLGLKGGIMMLN